MNDELDISISKIEGKITQHQNLGWLYILFN